MDLTSNLDLRDAASVCSLTVGPTSINMDIYGEFFGTKSMVRSCIHATTYIVSSSGAGSIGPVTVTIGANDRAASTTKSGRVIRRVLARAARAFQCCADTQSCQR